MCCAALSLPEKYPDSTLSYHLNTDPDSMLSYHPHTDPDSKQMARSEELRKNPNPNSNTTLNLIGVQQNRREKPKSYFVPMFCVIFV